MWLSVAPSASQERVLAQEFPPERSGGTSCCELCRRRDARLQSRLPIGGRPVDGPASAAKYSRSRWLRRSIQAMQERVAGGR